MVVNFSAIDYSERPTLILKNASERVLGVLGYAKNTVFEPKYNEVSNLSFEVPAYVDGKRTPLYDDVIGMKVIKVPGIGQFILMNPEETNDGVLRQKSCTAYSLEYEFTYKKITIPKGTYKFFDDTDTANTVLGMIMELMPAWTIGSVSESLVGRYRTFDESNENVYNFIKSTVQSSFGCIFDFDTINKRVNVRDVNDEVAHKPVFISNDNLASEIVLNEETEGIVTRLDVSGANGVDIRTVNPTGTNKIIDLSYFMTESNFDSELIEKYNDWSELVESKQEEFFNLSVRYILKVSQKATEDVKLVELNGEYATLDNQRSVIVQAIAQGLPTYTQEDLDEINAQLQAKQNEIDAQKSYIETVVAEEEMIFGSMQDIRDECSFDGYFTGSERAQLDRYIKDGEVQDSSFVITESENYADAGAFTPIEDGEMSVSGGEVTEIDDGSGRVIYRIKGGSFSSDGSDTDGEIAIGTIEVKDGHMVASFYLANGGNGDVVFGNACATYIGDVSDVSADETSFSCTIDSGSGYITYSVTEFERQSIAQELYEYGREALKKLSQPTYTFSVTSANFFSLDEFVSFRDSIRLGEKVYIDVGDDRILMPIFIGATIAFDTPEELTLEFSDSFVSSDSEFKLVDLLEQSISMGKDVNVNKYAYSSFVESGASEQIKEFMNGNFDVSKNALFSSKNQAISWDGSGIKLRKYANEAQTAYEDEQIWMINNSIVLTDDGWQSAKMAIGKFHDEELGDCWGIIAPMIVGKMIVGSGLVIETQKKSDGTAVFRVDEGGARMYNGDISVVSEEKTIVTHIVTNISGTDMLDDPELDEPDVIRHFDHNSYLIAVKQKTVLGVTYIYCYAESGESGWVRLSDTAIDSTDAYRSQIAMHPDVGFVIGKFPMFDETTGGFNRDNANMWIDDAGNIHMRGVLEAATGQFSGNVYATDGVFNGTVYATNGEFTGKVNATDGTFKGRVMATELTIAGTGLDEYIDGADKYKAWLRTNENGLEIRKQTASGQLGEYYTLYSDDGMHIHQSEEEIMRVAKRRVTTPELAVMPVNNTSGIVMKSMSDGGVAFIWEG